MTKEEAAARDRLDGIARSWSGTPFHDHACVKGVGCDCAQFLRGVFVEAGLIAPFETGYYSPQHFLHQKQERFLSFVQRFADEISETEAKPGDVVLYRVGHVYAHGALIIKPGWPAIIHAHFATRRVLRGNGNSPHLGVRVIDKKFFSYFARKAG